MTDYEKLYTESDLALQKYMVENEKLEMDNLKLACNGAKMRDKLEAIKGALPTKDQLHKERLCNGYDWEKGKKDLSTRIQNILDK